MILTRYRQWCQTTHRHEMLADPLGSWVLYSDVMAGWAATGPSEGGEITA